jgi:hypothetical protein
MGGLFHGIRREPDIGGSGADVPADDLSGIGIDDEGDTNKPLSGGHIGEIRHSEHARRGHAELAVRLVRRTWQLLVLDRRLVWLTLENTVNIADHCQLSHGAAGHIESFATQLLLDLANVVDLPVCIEGKLDVASKRLISFGTIRQPRRIAPLRHVIAIGGRGNRQHVADRFDPVRAPMIINELDHRFDQRPNSAIAKSTCAGLAKNLVRLTRPAVLAFQCLHALCHLAGGACKLAAINLG